MCVRKRSNMWTAKKDGNGVVTYYCADIKTYVRNATPVLWCCEKQKRKERLTSKYLAALKRSSSLFCIVLFFQLRKEQIRHLIVLLILRLCVLSTLARRRFRKTFKWENFAKAYKAGATQFSSFSFMGKCMQRRSRGPSKRTLVYKNSAATGRRKKWTGQALTLN